MPQTIIGKPLYDVRNCYIIIQVLITHLKAEEYHLLEKRETGVAPAVPEPNWRGEGVILTDVESFVKS